MLKLLHYGFNSRKVESLKNNGSEKKNGKDFIVIKRKGKWGYTHAHTYQYITDNGRNYIRDHGTYYLNNVFFFFLNPLYIFQHTGICETTVKHV